jgi:hypothetical protein
MIIQPAIAPFDYGSLVQWTDTDGSFVSGDIVAFHVGPGGEQAATVELADGTDRTIPISALHLLPS